MHCGYFGRWLSRRPRLRRSATGPDVGLDRRAFCPSPQRPRAGRSRTGWIPGNDRHRPAAGRQPGRGRRVGRGAAGDGCAAAVGRHRRFGPVQRRGRAAPGAMRSERGVLASGPAAAGAVAPAALAAARAAADRGDRVLLRRRAQRRGHHRRDRRRCRSGSASSTSTGPRRPPRRCTPRSTTRPWCSATAAPTQVDVTALVPGDVVRAAARRHRPGRHPAARRRPAWSATSRC